MRSQCQVDSHNSTPMLQWSAKLIEASRISSKFCRTCCCRFSQDAALLPTGMKSDPGEETKCTALCCFAVFCQTHLMPECFWKYPSWWHPVCAHSSNLAQQFWYCHQLGSICGMLSLASHQSDSNVRVSTFARYAASNAGLSAECRQSHWSGA